MDQCSTASPNDGRAFRRAGRSIGVGSAKDRRYPPRVEDSDPLGQQSTHGLLRVQLPNRILLGTAQRELSERQSVEGLLQRGPAPAVVGAIVGHRQNFLNRRVELRLTRTALEARGDLHALLERRLPASRVRASPPYLGRRIVDRYMLHHRHPEGGGTAAHDHQMAGWDMTRVRDRGVVAVERVGKILVAIVALELPVGPRKEQGPRPSGLEVLHPSNTVSGAPLLFTHASGS